MKVLHVPTRGSMVRGPSVKIGVRMQPNDQRKGHMPRLDTILMVEEVIKSNEVFDSKNQLSRSLPKSMQYDTLLKILGYLEDSNKIIIEKDGTIIWTFVDSPEARKSLEESKPL